MFLGQQFSVDMANFQLTWPIFVFLGQLFSVDMANFFLVFCVLICTHALKKNCIHAVNKRTPVRFVPNVPQQSQSLRFSIHFEVFFGLFLTLFNSFFRTCGFFFWYFFDSFFSLFFSHVRGQWPGGSKTPGVHITDTKRGQVESVKERASDRKRLTRPSETDGGKRRHL